MKDVQVYGGPMTDLPERVLPKRITPDRLWVWPTHEGLFTSSGDNASGVARPDPWANAYVPEQRLLDAERERDEEREAHVALLATAENEVVALRAHVAALTAERDA